jgi:hypothetical protein
MRPNISEFSYGFALTSELIQSPGRNITAAPVFPSLLQEGQSGGGWDVRVDDAGVPLFLQFKLCDYMTRRTCAEVKKAAFNVPCYRMHLRSAKISRQHEMLLDLEAQGQEVYYSAPSFHEPEHLNDVFLSRTVRASSVWVKPSDIGPLPDTKDHHLSFEPGGPWTFFSEPRRIEKRREFEQVAEELENRLRREGKDLMSGGGLRHLADRVEAIAEKRRDIGLVEKHRTKRTLIDVPPLQRVAYYASVFLESQMFVVQEKLQR